MTEHEYLLDWLERLGKAIDDGDAIGRLRLMQEAKGKPFMSLVVVAIEFMLPKLDSAEAAKKVALEIALKAKVVTNNFNRDVKAETGGAIFDMSTDKQVEVGANA